MPKLTKAEWLAQIEDCGNDLSQDELVNLVFADGPNALWRDTIEQMKLVYPTSMYNYLTGLFPTRVWNDWQGVTELGTRYHAAHIPFDMSIFQRSMQICDPASQNECRTDYCTLPKGGISAIPELEMYKTGFKTEPMCIANIRTSARAKQIAEAIVNERFQTDEQVMNIFYTMALIRMTGHKWVLEFEKSGNDVIPIADSNPRNALGGFRYSFMNPLYPVAGNLENIMPLDINFLKYFGSSLTDSRNPHFISTGPRGEPIFELWYPTDWYQQEILDNKEFIDRNKFTMKIPPLNGSTLNPEREVVGNFSMRSVPGLPRFAESTEGGLTVVQPMTPVDVDQGHEHIYNYREYRNAPFILIQMLGKNPGEILTRPAINVGIEGRPIMPITGNGDWVYWNEYDSVCNPDKNMPHFRRRYEMGFRALNPDASWGMIARAKKIRLIAPNTCDLQPVFKVVPSKQDCSILTVGCNPLNKRVPNNITGDSKVRQVQCSSKACGDSDNLLYQIKITKENQDSIAPNQSPLGTCVCGSTIQVHIGDADGDTTKVRAATLVDIYRPNMVNPNWTAVIKLASALTGAECIQSVGCPDATPTYGLVVACADHSEDDTIPANGLRVVLDSTLNCNAGANVTVGFYDADGVLIDSAIAGTISSVDPITKTYVIATSESGFGCGFKEAAVTIRVTCD